MFDNITPQGFEDYTGIEPPTNFERLKTLSASIISRYNLNDISDECQLILEQAVYEQILFFSQNTDLGKNKVATSKSAGNASVSYAMRDDWQRQIAPLTEQLLMTVPCNFNYRGLSTSCCKC